MVLDIRKSSSRRSQHRMHFCICGSYAGRDEGGDEVYCAACLRTRPPEYFQQSKETTASSTAPQYDPAVCITSGCRSTPEPGKRRCTPCLEAQRQPARERQSKHRLEAKKMRDEITALTVANESLKTDNAALSAQADNQKQIITDQGRRLHALRSQLAEAKALLRDRDYMELVHMTHDPYDHQRPPALTWPGLQETRDTTSPKRETETVDT